MTRTTGATDAQIRPETLLALNVAVQMAVDIDAYSAASGETEAGNIADVILADLRRSGYEIVRVDDLRALVQSVDRGRMPWSVTEAIDRIQAAIGEAE